MIIACPACATRYVVPDSAIAVEGRTVRCAKCRHSWHQDGPATVAPTVGGDTVSKPTPTPPPVSAPVSAPAPVSAVDMAEHAAAPSPRPQPVPPPTPVPDRAEPVIPAAISAPFDDDVSQFDPRPPFRPRRNWLKLWTVAAAIFAVVALGSLAALSYWGMPDWLPMARSGGADSYPDLKLDVPPNRQDRRTLPNGTEYFGINATVTNIGAQVQRLPAIVIVLRDARERIVYSWEVAPPQRRLAPGESVTINEAMTDVPKSAKIAEIGWKPG